MEQKLLKVYDTLTKEYIDVEVSEEVYKAYKRSEWNIDKQDSSFEQHVIMFCELKGEVENFDEMTSDEDNHVIIHYGILTKYQGCVLTEQIRTISVLRLKKYIGRLSEKDIRRIEKALRISLDMDNKGLK